MFNFHYFSSCTSFEPCKGIALARLKMTVIEKFNKGRKMKFPEHGNGKKSRYLVFTIQLFAGNPIRTKLQSLVSGVCAGWCVQWFFVQSSRLQDREPVFPLFLPSECVCVSSEAIPSAQRPTLAGTPALDAIAIVPTAFRLMWHIRHCTLSFSIALVDLFLI